MYFVYRCPYLTQNIYVKYFADVTVYEWFSDHFQACLALDDPDRRRAYIENVVGTETHGMPSLGRLFEELTEDDAIEDASAIASHIHEYSWEGEAICHPQHISIITDDDELEMAYFFVDADYAAAHRSTLAFLVHQGPLPDARPGDEGAPPLRTKWRARLANAGPGSVYVVRMEYKDSLNLVDLSELETSARLDGARVPDLAPRLLTMPDVGELAFSFKIFRGLFTVRDPADNLDFDAQDRRWRDRLLASVDRPQEAYETWQVWNDWRLQTGRTSVADVFWRHAVENLDHWTQALFHWSEDEQRAQFGRGTPESALDEYLASWPERDPDLAISRDVNQVGRHLIDVSLPLGTGATHFRIIVFDDVWVAAHPELAESLLLFARTWSPLAPEA